MKLLSTLLLALLVSSCAIGPLETTYIPAEIIGWKVGHAYDDGTFGRGTIVEYVPESENIKSWSKLITIQFMENSLDTPASLHQKLKQNMEEKCSNTKWEVIDESDTSLLYEWSIRDCSAGENQYEISKLLLGNDGLHRAAYTEKTANIKVSVREQWVSNLREAYVVKDGKKVVINNQ